MKTSSENQHLQWRQTRVQYPGATLGGQAGHYPTPAVKGMRGVVRENTLSICNDKSKTPKWSERRSCGFFVSSVRQRECGRDFTPLSRRSSSSTSIWSMVTWWFLVLFHVFSMVSFLRFLTLLRDVCIETKVAFFLVSRCVPLSSSMLLPWFPTRRRLSFCLLALRGFWTSQARPGPTGRWPPGEPPTTQLFDSPTSQEPMSSFLSKCAGCPANDSLEMWFRMNIVDIVFFWSTLP